MRKKKYCKCCSKQGHLESECRKKRNTEDRVKGKGMEWEKGKEQIVLENIPEEEEVGQKVNEVVLDHKHGVDGNINLESIGTEKSTCNMESVGLIQT